MRISREGWRSVYRWNADEQELASSCAVQIINILEVSVQEPGDLGCRISRRKGVIDASRGISICVPLFLPPYSLVNADEDAEDRVFGQPGIVGTTSHRVLGLVILFHLLLQGVDISSCRNYAV